MTKRGGKGISLKGKKVNIDSKIYIVDDFIKDNNKTWNFILKHNDEIITIGVSEFIVNYI